MDATRENRQLIQHVFAELAEGRGQAFLDNLADDFRWTIKSRGAWGGMWAGRDAVRTGLLDPLFAQFAGTYTNTAERIIADGDLVAVECRGSVATRRGARYDNSYCWVMRVEDGRIRELTEYMDTELAATVLEAPAPAQARTASA